MLNDTEHSGERYKEREMKRLLKQGLWCVHEVREGASMTRGGKACGGSRNCANPRAEACSSLTLSGLKAGNILKVQLVLLWWGGGRVAEKEHRSKVT